MVYDWAKERQLVKKLINKSLTWPEKYVMINKHIMIDIETLSIKNNAAILSIGAVLFDLSLPHFHAEQAVQSQLDQAAGHNKLETLDFFYSVIDMADYNSNKAFDIDYSTVKWWLSQDYVAQQELLTRDKTIFQALSEFTYWCRKTLNDNDIMLPWSHGAVFDIPIIEHALGNYSIIIPWKYSNIRDTRTLFDVANEPLPKHSMPHHALWDAYYQAKHVHYCWRKLQSQK